MQWPPQKNKQQTLHHISSLIEFESTGRVVRVFYAMFSCSDETPATSSIGDTPLPGKQTVLEARSTRQIDSEEAVSEWILWATPSAQV